MTETRTLRIENFRNGAWETRGEGPIAADVTLTAIQASADSSALNGPARALVDGAVVYETKKISRKRAKELFGF